MAKRYLLDRIVHRAVKAGGTHGGEIISAAGASTLSSRLAQGVYRLCSDADFWYRIGDASVDAGPAIAGSGFLAKGETDFVEIPFDNAAAANADQYIAANGTGNFSIVKRNR